jgi:hypothetical protein
MKDIQLQLQMSKELGVYSDDGIRHVNQLKGEYSVLLRELRKRKHKNKRRILQKMLGCSNPFKSKVLLYIIINKNKYMHKNYMI